MSTNTLSKKDIKRNWQHVDVKNKILGRVAVDIAKILRGKNNVNFVPYLDTGDYVVVTNASQVRVTGKKTTDKKYVRHSGYPGGLKVETFSTLLGRRPEEVLRHAIVGMLPKGRLGREMIKKLHIFATGEHSFQKQLKGETL